MKPIVRTLAVSQGPLPASRKVYHSGEQFKNLRVPMREIALHPSSGEAPVVVYDTSGPYSDSEFVCDLEKGLPRTRAAWIEARSDVESYAGRQVQPADNGFVNAESVVAEFPNKNQPFRAKGDAAVTQMAYARAGIITPEMEYIAVRENMSTLR